MKKIIDIKEVLKLMLYILCISLLLIFLLPICLLGGLLSGLVAGTFHIPGDFWKSGMFAFPYLIIAILSIVLIKKWRIWLLSVPVQVIVYCGILYFQYNVTFSSWLIDIIFVQAIVVGAKLFRRWCVNRKNQDRIIE